jgi:hypothetical protein
MSPSPPPGLRVPREVVTTFAASPRFARAGVMPSRADELRLAWEQHTGTKPRRDYTAIDESGDFDPVAGGGDVHAFLVGAAVSFDAGNYPRMASLLYGWRHHVFADEEVKASSPRVHMTTAREDDFLKELGDAAASGFCAVTLGVVDKTNHLGGVLLQPGFEKVVLRREFHMDLLRAHVGTYRPRTQYTRLYIDDCGLTGPERTEYAKTVRALELSVSSDVLFVDSLLVEMIQLADLTAGIVRRRLDDPDLADADVFDSEFASLGRRFLLADLTARA